MVADVLGPDSENVLELQRLRYIGVGSEELLKKEVGLAAGSRIPNKNPITGITMQISSGHGNELVNADIQGMIFHSDMYGPGNETIRSEIRKNEAKIKQDLADLKSGKISARIRDKIERGANIDVNDWDNLRFSSRQAAIKFRSEAIDLQRAILSGDQKIQNIPGLLKRAERMLTRDFFKTDRQYVNITKAGTAVNDFLNLPILPFSQRNAIDTEVRVSNAGDEIILGGRFADRETIQVERSFQRIGIT